MSHLPRMIKQLSPGQVKLGLVAGMGGLGLDGLALWFDLRSSLLHYPL